MEEKKNKKICVIGLGYVGLPLAVAFAEKFSVIGYDINAERVHELRNGIDRTQEIDKDYLLSVLKSEFSNSEIPSSNGLYCTQRVDNISNCNIFIITVPTPIDKFNRPLLTPMIKATETVAKILKEEDVVIYESTVYPGVTEDEMVPILEKISGLSLNKNFFVGYSPERINPGDKEHTVTKIKKVTSGSSKESARFIDNLYKEIIVAGTYLAPSIKVAEAAKVIENSQRDINIAFVNELSKIFKLLNIDTSEVLEAASTKWNFLPFKPGLVGGHCIGVDPFYLAQKAQLVGYHPEIILAGRRLNDSMGKFVVNEVVKLSISKNCSLIDSKALVLGITFKENCPDIRNTRVIDIIKELASFNIQTDVFDPWADKDEVKKEFNLNLIEELNRKYSIIIIAVGHDQFLKLNIQELREYNSVVFDVKGVLPPELSDARL